VLDLVHRGKRAHVGKPNRGGDQFGFLCSGLAKKRINAAHNISGLICRTRAGRLERDLSGGIYRVSVHHGLAHAITNLNHFFIVI